MASLRLPLLIKPLRSADRFDARLFWPRLGASCATIPSSPASSCKEPPSPGGGRSSEGHCSTPGPNPPIPATAYASSWNLWMRPRMGSGWFQKETKVEPSCEVPSITKHLCASSMLRDTTCSGSNPLNETPTLKVHACGMQNREILTRARAVVLQGS